MASFQSAPPVKGATVRVLAPHGTFLVSIRAPREGGDPGAKAPSFFKIMFQSAPPVKGATRDSQQS